MKVGFFFLGLALLLAYLEKNYYNIAKMESAMLFYVVWPELSMARDCSILVCLISLRG